MRTTDTCTRHIYYYQTLTHTPFDAPSKDLYLDFEVLTIDYIATVLNRIIYHTIPCCTVLYRVSVPYCTVSAYALCLPLLFVCTVFSSTTQHIRKKEEIKVKERKGRKKIEL
jgi:hypothetical protein